MSFHVVVGTSTTVSRREEGLDTPREKRKWSMLTAMASRTSASIVSSCSISRKYQQKCNIGFEYTLHIWVICRYQTPDLANSTFSERDDTWYPLPLTQRTKTFKCTYEHSMADHHIFSLDTIVPILHLYQHTYYHHQWKNGHIPQNECRDQDTQYNMPMTVYHATRIPLP